MSTPVIESPSASYFAAVQAALADLPAADRADLLDDVRQHLDEVCAETCEPLATTLGPPTVYATELRAAAGLPAVTRSPDPVSEVPVWRKLLRHAVTRSTMDFLISLRPAWWVLRGVTIAALLVLTWHPVTVAIRPTASAIAELVVCCVFAAVISVLAGFGLLRVPRPARLAGVVVNVVIVLITLSLAAPLQLRLSELRRQVGDTNLTVTAPALTSGIPGSLTGPNGLIYNITPYDLQGNPLSGVQLFDQNGNPINVEVGQDPNGAPLSRQVPVSADGRALDNVFPQTQQVSGETPKPAPATVAAVPGASLAVVPPGPGSPQPVIVPAPGAAAVTASAAAAPAVALTPSPTRSP